MLRSALIALAVLLVTAAPSFGHSLTADFGAPKMHAAMPMDDVAVYSGLEHSDRDAPSACAHMVTAHCLTALGLTEIEQPPLSELSGRWQFHVHDFRLRGILPTAETPPPRT